MKKHDLLFLIIFCFALFDTQCSEEQNSNFFNVLPPEITERIFFLIFANADDPFPFTFTTQRVCWAWRNLVLKSKNTAQFLIKYKEEKNEEFFDKYDAYISGYGDPNNPPDYAFFDSPLFDLSTVPRYLLSDFNNYNFDAVEKLIKKYDQVLNDLLLDEICINQMINWDCVCVCKQSCLKNHFSRNNQKIIIDYITDRASFVSDKARLGLFSEFILDRESKYCMLRRLLPVLKIEEPDNSEYYFRFILHEIVKMDHLSDKYGKLIDKSLYYEDNRLNQYLLILVENKADFSSLGSQQEAYSKQILNIKHFPATKETLESILKK
ncbi:MAG TPA: hypothetical protein VL201_03430 [Patescibacteria group bacterium]|nr:hypothetical protein [Patescibacteria group bacterium]